MNIIKATKIWFSFSTLLVIASIVSIATFGLPLGIDFTGGTEMEIQFGSENDEGEFVATENIEINDIRKTIADLNSEEIGDPIVLETGENSYIIRTKDIPEELRNEMKTSITENVGSFEETRTRSIGATVGATLKESAIYSLTFALIGIVLFIAYSFRKVPKRVNPWKFSVAAIIALFHDVLITVGVFAYLSTIFGYEINLFFITALLTILGYSVNDTIVVFDRVRENLKFQKRDEPFADVANRSLMQTLPRSLNTSITTLITLFTLFFFGGQTIEFFVLTLIIGFFIGTYSSIFLATPILVAWKNKK